MEQSLAGHSKHHQCLRLRLRTEMRDADAHRKNSPSGFVPMWLSCVHFPRRPELSSLQTYVLIVSLHHRLMCLFFLPLSPCLMVSSFKVRELKDLIWSTNAVDDAIDDAQRMTLVIHLHQTLFGTRSVRAVYVYLPGRRCPCWR